MTLDFILLNNTRGEVLIAFKLFVLEEEFERFDELGAASDVRVCGRNCYNIVKETFFILFKELGKGGVVISDAIDESIEDFLLLGIGKNNFYFLWILVD
jgi:hypothetical protein